MSLASTSGTTVAHHAGCSKRPAFSTRPTPARRGAPLALARASCFLFCTITPSRPRELPDCHSLRASSLSRNFKGSLVDPRMRASNRGHSDSLTPPEGTGRLFFTARIGRALSHRARSASKKNGLPVPSHHSKTARCASTGDSPGHHSHAGGLFQHPAISLIRYADRAIALPRSAHCSAGGHILPLPAELCCAQRTVARSLRERATW